MRWLTFSILSAALFWVLLRRQIADYVFYCKAEKCLADARVSSQTAEGMEYARLSHDFDKSYLPVAERYSRLMLSLSQRVPPRFKWQLRRRILQLADDEVLRHPRRSEAWALMANAQYFSGQKAQAVQSVHACRRLDFYGTTFNSGLNQISP